MSHEPPHIQSSRDGEFLTALPPHKIISQVTLQINPPDILMLFTVLSDVPAELQVGASCYLYSPGRQVPRVSSSVLLVPFRLSERQVSTPQQFILPKVLKKNKSTMTPTFCLCGKRTA